MSEHVLTSLPRFRKGMLACVFVTAWLPLSSLAQASSKTSPWSNSALSPGERATLVLKEMTLDEKIALVHGHGMSGERPGMRMP
jgi:beta-glucosidase